MFENLGDFLPAQSLAKTVSNYYEKKLKEEKIEITGETWTSIKIRLADVILVNCFKNPNLKKINKVTDVLYHYTNLDNLISIIENQTLYASDINFLNDKKEFKYGIELIKGMTHNKEFSTSKRKTEITEYVHKNIDKKLYNDNYIICFSKEGDMLSQWRAYADNGKGVAIGFNAQNIASSLNMYMQNVNIEYDIHYQECVIFEILDIILNYFENIYDSIEWADYNPIKLIGDVIIDFLKTYIQGFKHPSFSEEQEYRLMHEQIGNNEINPLDLNFRRSGNLISPFIKIRNKYYDYKSSFPDEDVEPSFVLKHLPIEEIVIGPSLDFESIKHSLKKLLQKHNYTDVDIKRSDIPYRI